MNKKYYLALAATAALFAGCSSDDNFADESRMATINDGDKAKIELLLGNAGTRGTGTVGGMAENDPNNKWGGQTFKVYMLDKGELTVAKDADNNVIYENTVFTAPNELGGVATDQPALEVTETANGGLVIDSKVSYFPQEGNFDFWAYRLDDATATVPALNVAETALTTTFTIDGSQDIMVAKAVPNVVPNDDGTYGAKNVPESRIFSAYSVRREVKPMLNFKHLLARLQFKIKASKDLSRKANDMSLASPQITANENAVRVTAIKLKSQKTGELVVAYKGDEPTELITWDGTTAIMSLKERTMNYTPAVLEWGEEAVTGIGQTIHFETCDAIVTTAETMVFNSKTPTLDAQGLPTGGKTIAAYQAAGDQWTPYTYVVKTEPEPIAISVNAPLGDLPAEGISPIWDLAQEEASATGDGSYATPIGEALLLAPAASYELTLETSQLVPSETKTYYYMVEVVMGGSAATYGSEDASATVADEDAYDALETSAKAGKGDAAALTAAEIAANVGKYFFNTTDGKVYKIVEIPAVDPDYVYYFISTTDAAAALTAYNAWVTAGKPNTGATKTALDAALAKGSDTQGAKTVTTASTTINSTKTITLKGPKVAALSGDTNGSYKANKSYTITLTLAGMEAITGGSDNITIGGYEVDTEGGSNVAIDMDEEPSLP